MPLLCLQARPAAEANHGKDPLWSNTVKFYADNVHSGATGPIFDEAPKIKPAFTMKLKPTTQKLPLCMALSMLMLWLLLLPCRRHCALRLLLLNGSGALRRLHLHSKAPIKRQQTVAPGADAPTGATSELE